MTEHTKDETASKPMYVSKDGFDTVRLIRGFTEIIPLWDIMADIGHCWICGGYARYCASPKQTPVKAGDIDVYFEDDSAYETVKARLLKEGLEIRHENKMALTYKAPEDNQSPLAYMPTIQLIQPLEEARLISVGTRTSILGSFDFTVIRASILSPTEVMVDADFMHDETHGLIRIKNIHCPVSSTLRCLKYARKGYFLRPFECLKLFIDWQDRAPEYQRKLINFLHEAGQGNGLSQEEVDELEAMMRID